MTYNNNISNQSDFRRNNSSNLDVIISTMNIADKINFVVNSNRRGSDYFPVYLSINTLGDS